MCVADTKGFLPVHVASMQESATLLSILLQTNTADKNKREYHTERADF